MVDPGFRDPVVQLTWSTDLDSGGVTNDLRTLQPLQGFVRPEIACKEQQKVERVRTFNDYSEKLSADASVSADVPGTFTFSASAGYRNFARTISDKKSKTFLMKVYCLQYVAGLSEVLPWEHTAAFETALNKLPDTFDEGDRCSWEEYRTDHETESCDRSVAEWIRFFKEFGTHTVKLVHLGGKIAHQITVSGSDLTKLKNKGVDVQAALKATVGLASGSASTSVSTEEDQQRQEQNLKTDIQTTVIGGEPPEDIKDKNMLAIWSKTVKEFPMPVRVELLPLDNEMKSIKHKKSYKKAFIFYSKAFGFTQQEVEAMQGTITPLSKQLYDSTSVFYAGKPGGYAACPQGTVIIAGFGLHMNFKKHKYGLGPYHMVSCTPGADKCSVPGVSHHERDDTRVWAMCAATKIPLVQIVKETSHWETTAECPEGMEVGFGFGISFGEGKKSAATFKVVSCRRGQTKCFVPAPEGCKKTYVWIACLDPTTPGFDQIESAVTQGKSHRSPLTVRCNGKGKKILKGFGMEFNTTFDSSRVRAVFKPVNDLDEASRTVRKSGQEITRQFSSSDRFKLWSFAICSAGHGSPQLGVATTEHKHSQNPERRQRTKRKKNNSRKNWWKRSMNYQGKVDNRFF
eukprot:GHVQ01014823.1.p1 GENE.GHVQ01014823.1~~GHVQ01014823.1.p1  ORF type:complete len:628 (+),score=44.65 GHVQ01014823.1:842-2725(+)